MITAILFPAGFGIPNPSPFCMKVEILLKMAGLPYGVERESNPTKGPKGKIPFIRDGNDVIGDSGFIQAHLETRYGVDFDKGLSGPERAVAHGLARMCEERLYWCLVYSRWIDAQNWPTVSTFFFADLPPVVRSIVPILSRRGVRAGLNGNGIGRHSAEEIYALGTQDINALAAHLGTKPFMMGDTPSSLDAVAYPFIEGLTVAQLPSPLMTAIEQHASLLAYRDRCRGLWFTEDSGLG
jgi:glutathione S-transferase